MTSPPNTNGFHNFLKHWPIVAAIASLAVTWGVFTATLAANKDADVLVEQRVTRIEQDMTEIKEAIARMEVRQTVATQEMARVRESLDSILRELRQEGDEE